MADFGGYLQALREARGYTVNQLAMYAGVSASLISRVENNKRGAPKYETLQKIADTLKVPIFEMLYMAGWEGVVEHTIDFVPSDIARTYMTAKDFEEYNRIVKSADIASVGSPSIPPEEREFLKWVKEQVSDSFFYDWDKDPEERKSDYIKGLRLIYELEKGRKPGQKQGE